MSDIRPAEVALDRPRCERREALNYSRRGAAVNQLTSSPHREINAAKAAILPRNENSGNEVIIHAWPSRTHCRPIASSMAAVASARDAGPNIVCARNRQ